MQTSGRFVKSRCLQKLLGNRDLLLTSLRSTKEEESLRGVRRGLALWPWGGGRSAFWSCPSASVRTMRVSRCPRGRECTRDVAGWAVGLGKARHPGEAGGGSLAQLERFSKELPY